MLRRPLALAAAAVLLLAAPPATAAAQPAPPNGPQALTSVPLPNFDRLDPSADPVQLTSAPRDLNVTYTYNGQQHTLQDYLNRTTQGFVVLDGDKIVDEWYAPGYSKDSLFQSWSMAKSFTSLAVGIALDEGKIGSIDDTVGKYVPELAKADYGSVTIRNLLRMESGIDWTEDIADIPLHVLASLGWQTTLQMAANQHSVVPQGTTFNYTSMNTAVLAIVLARAVGEPYYKYVQDKVWGPGGMASTAYIGSDSHGDDLGYCCYYANDRDFARIGKLMMDDGLVHGRQIVSPDWIARSTTPSSSVATDYGLSWWLDGSDGYFADGLGDQKVYVSTKYHVVIVKSTFFTIDTAESSVVFRAVAQAVAQTR